MSFQILNNPKPGQPVLAVAGGKNPRISFREMMFSYDEIDDLLTKDESNRMKDSQYYNFGQIPLFSRLLSLFSDGEPMILYTAEDGECDTCLKIFLKYGEGQRPKIDQLEEIRTCMDNYDFNIKEVVPKIEKLMEVLFPEELYRFEYCLGIMADQWGNFTWNRYQSHNYLPCASPWSHIITKYNGTRCMSLIASQSEEAYSEEWVEYYRQQIRAGKRLGCIVYRVPHLSNYAIILDGHHRVIASMLEGVFPQCLMITEPYYELVTKKGETILNLQPMNISKKNPGIRDLSEEVLGILRKNIEQNRFNRCMVDDEKIKYYKYYRRNTKKSSTYFPGKYETAAKNMIDECTLN